MGVVLEFSGFKGTIPKLSPRLLPEGCAQAATNIKTSSGEVRPYRKSKVVSQPNKTLPPLSIYRATNGTVGQWFSWPSDVNVARFPFPQSVEPRFGWSGDHEPRWAPYNTAITGGGNDYPHSFYALGIPVPTSAVSVTPSGGAGSTVSRSYCYTFFSQHGEESGPSPTSTVTSGKVDGSWAVTGMSAFPINTSTGTASYAAGVTTFTDTASAPHWLRVGDEVILNSTELTVASCPTAYSFTVAGDYHTATSWSRVAPWNTTGMTRRLYRTDGTAASFQLVVDGLTSTSYTDTLLAANILGDELISQGWEPPPATMINMGVTSFGSLYGTVNNVLYLSEPYQPHAFSDAYTYASDYDIVACALAATDLAVATTAYPYFGVGSDPSNFQLVKQEAPLPCLSKRSMASDGTGALYATKHGIAYMAGGTTKVISEDFWTVDEWTPLNPATMFFELAYGRIFIGYTDSNGVNRLLLLNTNEGSLFSIDILASCLYRDNSSGTLYMGTANGIEEFDPQDGAPLNLEWWSKEEVLAKPVNLGAAKIDFTAAIDPVTQAAQQAAYNAAVAVNAPLMASGDIGGYFGASYWGQYEYAGSSLVDVPAPPAQNTVAFTLFEGGEVMFSTVVDSDAAFRLPAGYRGDHYSVKINSQCAVKRVLVAETMADLRQR